MPKQHPQNEHQGALRRFAAAVVRPPAIAFAQRIWLGRENIPATGGVVVACNHLSVVDPVLIAHYVYASGRFPRFLGKDSVLTAPVVGRLLRDLGQIPVYRETSRATDAFRAAVEVVQGGGCVVVYPEATVTRDPAHWPMTGKTGAVRIVAETGAPLVPLVTWGAQRIWPYGGKPRPLPRKRVMVRADEPLDLSAYHGRAKDAAAMSEATMLVMRHLAEMLAELRGVRPPAQLYDRTQMETGR